MPYKVEDYYNAVDQIASFSDSESWDNTGILIGSKSSTVTAALVALDVTMNVVAEARLVNANLIITHHPVIFPQLGRIDGGSPVYELIASRINVISAHTNFDKAGSGVNDVLAKALGLSDIKIMESVKSPGFARIGQLAEPVAPGAFAQRVKSQLKLSFVKYTTGIDIQTVAVCGGSGGELWQDARLAGAQALVTAEVKHHQLLEAKRAGFTLLDAGHHGTEVMGMAALRGNLSKLLPQARILLSQAQGDPADYV